MKRLFLYLGIGALVVIMGMASWFNKGKSPPYTGPIEKIHVGTTRTVFSLLIVIAAEKGLFAQNGLDVNIKEYESGRVAVDHLLQGEVDIATAADFVFTNQSLDRDDLRIMASIATSGSEEIVARKDKGIDQPADLKGKRIGVSLNTSAEYTLMRFLTFNRIPFDGVELVDLSPSQLKESLADGYVDAIISWENWVYEIKERMGENAVNWSARIGQDFYWLLITKDSFIQAKAPAIERFLRAVVQAEEFVRLHMTEAQALLVRKWKRDPDFIAEEWKRNKFIVSLDQGLIVAMEGEAEWRIKMYPTRTKYIPNYMRFIYMNALDTVKPEANLIFK